MRAQPEELANIIVAALLLLPGLPPRPSNQADILIDI